MSKFPWIFWFNISIRTKWFSYFWKTRGSNYIEIQLWIFKISIGRPWLKNVLKSQIRDYKSLSYTKDVNNNNLLNKFSFQVGKY